MKFVQIKFSVLTQTGRVRMEMLLGNVTIFYCGLRGFPRNDQLSIFDNCKHAKRPGGIDLKGSHAPTNRTERQMMKAEGEGLF